MKDFFDNYITLSDIILGVIVFYGASKGYKKGFLVELLSTIFLLIGLFIVFYASSSFLSWGNFHNTTNLFFYIITYLIFGIFVSIISRKLSHWVSYSVFEDFDNIIGMVLGGFKHILFLAFFIGILDAVGVDPSGVVSNKSKIYPFLLFVKNGLIDIIGYLLPIVKDLDKEIHNLLK